MKVALINCPPYNTSIESIPVGLGYIGAYMKKKRHKVFVFDLAEEFSNEIGKNLRVIFSMNCVQYWWQTSNFLKIKPLLKNFYEKKVNEILNTGARVIGFSVFTHQLTSSLLLAKMIKKKDKRRIIIFGGPAWLFYGKEILLKNDCVDGVVIGEGELTFNEIINSVNKTGKVKLIPGLMIKRNGKIFYGGERPLIKNLDSLPFLYFSGLPIEKYKHEEDNEPYYETTVSRGCPFNCSFCDTKTFWPYYRYRSAENIFQEIKEVKEKYNTTFFLFADNLINGNIKELSKLCDLIIKSNLKIKWMSMCSAREEMDKKLFVKMYKSGCDTLMFGIDSGSQKVLDEMNKKINIKSAERNLKDAHDAGINTYTSFIVGFPTENNFDFMKTILFLIKNRKFIKNISLTPCIIYPNTDLYRNFYKYGIDKKTLPNSYWNIGLWKTNDRKNTTMVRSLRFLILYVLSIFLAIKSSKDILYNRFYFNSSCKFH